MTEDRRTGIQGDQIEDNTITKEELDIVNSPVDKQSLGWDAGSQKFKWYYASDIANIFNYYQESEGESSTTLTAWQSKITYITPSVIAGNYEVWFQCEIKRGNLGAVQKCRLTVDDIEYCYQTGEADFVDWKLNKGFKRITFASSGTHTIKIEFSTGTAGRPVLIRRARIRFTSIGI